MMKLDEDTMMAVNAVALAPYAATLSAFPKFIHDVHFTDGIQNGGSGVHAHTGALAFGMCATSLALKDCDSKTKKNLCKVHAAHWGAQTAISLAHMVTGKERKERLCVMATTYMGLMAGINLFVGFKK